MKGFARVTKLSNIGGRADYISDPKRQEKIVAKSAPVDWEPYRRFEQANQRTAIRNNEGREVVIALPNSWAKLPTGMLAKRAQLLAETAIGKSTDLQWAVHWNKGHSNLHLHVVFSERQKESSMERWDRDIYHTADGKVARCKADRARLPDGSVAPPVHRKGELKGGFTAKDTKYKSKRWVQEMKVDVQKLMTEKWRVKFDAPDLLHEYHEGKGREAAQISAKNEAIRATNKAFAEFTAVNPDHIYSEKLFKRQARAAARQGKSLYLEYIWTEENGNALRLREGSPAEVAAVKPTTRRDEKHQSVSELVKSILPSPQKKRRQKPEKRPQERSEPSRAITPLPEPIRPPQKRPEAQERVEPKRESIMAALKRNQTMDEWERDIAAAKAAAPRHDKKNARELPKKRTPER